MMLASVDSFFLCVLVYVFVCRRNYGKKVSIREMYREILSHITFIVI